MSVTQILFIVFGALIIGLMLPFSYAVRMAIFLALTALGVVTFLGGGAYYIMSMFN
jgi:hypothetical protein